LARSHLPALQPHLHGQRGPTQGLDSYRPLLRGFALETANHPDHPVGAAFGLQPEQAADFQPLSLDLRNARSESSGADVLHDPAFDFARVELRLTGGIERGMHPVETIRDGEPRLDSVTLRSPLRRP